MQSSAPIEVLTVPEAMAVLRIKRNKIYDLMRTNQLASFTIGRARRIPATAVQAYIEMRTGENA